MTNNATGKNWISRTMSLPSFLSDARQLWRISRTVPVNLKKKLPTNNPQFIERTHFDWYTKKFIKNIRPCPGSNPPISPKFYL